jgi:hypothetical protein
MTGPSACRIFQAGSLVSVLLSLLPRMGTNAHIAARVLRGLASHGQGKLSLRTGAVEWHNEVAAAETGPVGAEDALQWAANRLRKDGGCQHTGKGRACIALPLHENQSNATEFPEWCALT